MANVPAIVYIGGRHTHGGIKPNTEFQSDGTYGTDGGTLSLRDTRIHRVVPDDPTTGNPSAATLGWYPVFDGTAGDTVYVVASGPTATTVTATPDPGWTANEWAGFTIRNNNLTGLGLRNRDIEVVSNTNDTLTVASWTATPEVGSGFWFNQGRFRDTHPIAAWRTVSEILGAAVPTRGGASWQLNNFGLSPVPLLTRELWENVWTTAPYFQLMHYFTQNPVVGNFDDTGAAERAAFLTEKARWDAAWTALATGDTLSWSDGYVILDMSQNDVENDTELNYYADLLEMIAWLRSAAVFNDATLNVILVNHDVRLNAVDHPDTQAACNTIHDLIALADANVTTVQLNGRELPLRQTDAATPTWAPNVNAKQYATTVYGNEYPRAIREHIELLEAGAATAGSQGLATFYVIGDSLTNATGFGSSFTTANDDINYPGTVRNPRQRIWNDATGAIETYDPHDNSATAGTVNANAGPEFSLLPLLQDDFPVDGTLVIKRGAGGSALATELQAYSGGGGVWSPSTSGEQWDELKRMRDEAQQYANTVLGRQVITEGLLVTLGTNDQATAGGGAAFATELATWVPAFRAEFDNAVVGKAMPIIWVLPQLGTSSADNTEALAVRAALRAYEKTDEQFYVVDIDDLPRASDNLHPTPASTITIGERMAEALRLIRRPNCTVS